MTTLAPLAPPPQRHFDPAADFLPRESTTGANGSPLRITHLGKFFHPAHGGIERTVRALAQTQAMLGCRVRVICMDHERGRATRVEQDGPVEIVRVRRAASFCKIDHCPDLLRVLRDSEADLLHLHTPNPSMILALMLSGDRRPLVVSHYSDVVKQCLRRVLFSPIERACYDRARLILSESPPYIAGSAVLRRYPDRVAVLPIGLELAPFLDPAPEVREHGDRLRRTYPGPLWFFCGRLVYYKGLETALHALRSVPGTLLIAGDGPARTHLERFAARLDLKDRVRFLGEDTSRRRPGRLLPGRARLLVPLERTQRGVRAGAGGGDGERLPGDQRGDPAQRRALGQPP